MANKRDFFIRNFNKGEFGLEQEGLRLTADGKMATSTHPFPGDKRIDRDFCENQIELITGVYPSIDELIDGIRSLKGETERGLQNLESGPEYLWPFSSPPAVASEDDIPIANFLGDLKEKTVYRNYLAEKYGKWIMLYSGIHYNFSFPDELIHDLFEESPFDDYRKFKDTFYLKLGKRVIEYSWLIVYLTAASPILDENFGACAPENIAKYASPRCSEIGYWNDFIPELDFTSIDAYVDSVEKYLDNGELTASSELYYPVRYKPRGSNDMEFLREKGINHIELRMLDLNPLCPEGIDRCDLYFIYLLMVYLTAIDNPHIDGSIKEAILNMKDAALYDDTKIDIRLGNGKTENIRDLTVKVLDHMEEVLSDLGADVSSCIDRQRQKALDESKRYAVIIREKFADNYVEEGMKLAMSTAQELIAKPNYKEEHKCAKFSE